MADWEESSPEYNPRARRAVKASAAQQTKAELLQAIAARRQAQLVRRNRASSPPSGTGIGDLRVISCPQAECCCHGDGSGAASHDGGSIENGERLYAVARKASTEILPESSEASGVCGDDEEDSGSNDSTSPTVHSKIRSNGRRRSSGRKSVPLQYAGGEEHCEESTVKSTSYKSSTVEDLSSVLDQISLKDKKGDGSRLKGNQFERSPKKLILNIRKRLVKKSTIADVESDSESESFASVDPVPAATPSADYTSADDGDVDSPVISKIKSKTKQAAALPKPFALPTTKLHISADDDNDNILASETKIKEKEVLPAVPASQKNPTTAGDPSNRLDSSEKEDEDFVLVEGRHRFTLRAKTAKMLYPHQRSGLEWFWSLHTKGMGGILGDDMGLGKTLQVASFLAGLFCTKNIKCALIVAPKTLIAHWVKELKVVGLARKTQDYSGTSVKAREFALQHVLQMGGVLLTTYDMVRCNFKALRGDYDGRDGYGDTSDDIVTWDYIILDEGHLVKNPNTQRAKSLREIPAAHRIVISGTPIQNHLQEMWALFDFCCPSLLGDRKEFKEKYERQILAGTDKNASDRQKRIGLAVAEELRQKFAPYFLRRLKSEVFPDSENKEERKLSRKNDLIVWLPLSERQEKLYRAFLNSNAAEETLSTGRQVLSALTVMKKICDHPQLLTTRAANEIAEGMEGILDTEDIQAAEAMTRSLAGMVERDERTGSSSCKIDFLMALLENLVFEGHRTLIFAQTRKMLNIIQDEILDRGWVFRRIDGTMKAAEREQCVQEFQSDEEIPLFLLTSQVGGLGLTLTGADRVVIVDPAWNPSTDNQSVDRAYRIGQKNDVVVYRLMTCGTIEEKIYRKQVFKGGLMKVATEKKNQMRYFSQGELGEMFKVPETGFKVSQTQRQLHKEHYSQRKVNELLQEHIEFLEGLGIAGVSHHDLLFTKEAEPLPPPGLEEEDLKASWEPRNPMYAAPRSKAASKPESYSWESSQAAGRGILAAANAGLQSRNAANDNWLKVQFLRSKLERLYRTLDDKALISRLPDQGASLEQKINDTQNELTEAETIASSKENVGTESTVVDLSSERSRPTFENQRPKPLGFNNSIPAVVAQPLPAKMNPVMLSPSPAAVVRVPVNVPKATPVSEMPNWSLLTDSPTSSTGSPAPTSRVDVDDMVESMSALKLRLH